MSSILSKRNLMAALLATSALYLAPAAFAADANDNGTIETVVVTASKRTENIQNVGASVTSVSDALINRVQANNLGDLAAYVPGLAVQSSGVDANRLIIRGLTTGPQDLSPTVGVYLDDVPFGSNSGFALGAFFSPDVDPFDLERVEVLRGPQGTLYGASTLAGLVKYVTRAPDTDSFDAHVRVDGGDESDTGATSYSARAGVNIPIVTDEVALRASGFYVNTGGDLTNVRTGQHDLNQNTKFGGRADLLIKPDDRWTIDLIAMVDHSDVPHVGEVTGNATTLKPIYGQYKGFDSVDGYARSNYTILEGNIRYDIPNGISVTSTTSWSHFNVKELADDSEVFQAAFTPTFGPLASLLEFPGPVRPNVDKVTEEFRVASPSNKSFEWLAGFFYDFERSDYVSGINSVFDFGATPPAALVPTLAAIANYETVNLHNRYVELAGFGNATYYVTPDFDLSAGLRYSNIDQHQHTEGSGFLALLGVIPTADSGSSSDSVLTESFDARWHFQPDQMLYARVARGYRPGGPNATGNGFAPDTTWNYELGLKSTMLDGRLTADLAAFYIDWQNIQLNFFNGTNTIIGNAGNARSQGVEFEGTYSPIENLTISANAAYTDATITGLIPGATGGAAVGNDLPYNSKWSSAIRADYFFPLGGDFEGNVGGAWRYKTSFNTTFPGDPGTRFYRLPAESFIDFRTGVSFSNYTLDLQVLNIFDQRKLSGASETLGGITTAQADAFGQPVDLVYTPGRTFGLSFTARY